MARALRFQKVVKGFVESDGGGGKKCLEGYNRFAKQAAVGPWRPASRRHGFYLVRPLESREAASLRGPSNESALVIDYAASRRNHRANPERFITDYLVRIGEPRSVVFIGAAYLGLGRRRRFSNFFILDEIGPVASTRAGEGAAR